MRPPAAPAVSRVRLKTRPSFGQLIGLIQPGADHLPRVALFDQSPTRPSQAAAQVRVALQAPDLPNRVDRRFSPQVVFFLHEIEAFDCESRGHEGFGHEIGRAHV